MNDKCIGSGTFGSVWKVRHKITNQIYAIKVINKEYIIKQNMIEQIKKEIEIMYKLNHPHIIKLYSHFEDEEDFCLIMEYASRGQLYSLSKGVLNSKGKYLMFLDEDDIYVQRDAFRFLY